MIWQVSNYEYTEIIEAKNKWEAEGKFMAMHYPTVLDDDMPNLEIDADYYDNLRVDEQLEQEALNEYLMEGGEL